MKKNKVISNILMLVGLLLILGAAGLIFYNNQESQQAGELSAQALEQILAIEESQAAETEPPAPTLPLAEEAPEMPLAEVDGRMYAGRISIPALAVELPVAAEWSYEALKTAPCRYYGSVYTKNMVVCGHSYGAHFGYLPRLEPGDLVIFTCTDGVEFQYEVAEVTILEPTAVEEMIAGDYPLSLFTCTKDSQARVTVRCNAASS